MVLLPNQYQDYPYSNIAPYIDLAAPMIYWHYYYLSAHFNYSKSFVQQYCINALKLTDDMFEKKMPLMMIGQSSDLGGTGVPSVQEIQWSIQAANKQKALGIGFFDWSGVQNSRFWEDLDALSYFQHLQIMDSYNNET
jgi:hypothetical protein